MVVFNLAIDRLIVYMLETVAISGVYQGFRLLRERSKCFYLSGLRVGTVLAMLRGGWA